MVRVGLTLAVAILAVSCWTGSVSAVVVKTIADAQLNENGTTGIGDAVSSGSGNGTSLNARWNFSNSPPDKNEWIALKFDLSAYSNKTELQNVALRTTMYRAGGNNTKTLRIYALTPGTSGENWEESSITYGLMPGFTFDQNSTTNVLDIGGAIQSLGTYSVSGVETEGALAQINPSSLTSLVKDMGTNDLLTLLISFNASSNGQWRIASREATQTETGAIVGSAGDFAAYLQFDVVPVVIHVKGDYNDNGLVDAADYTVWRNKVAGGGTLMNEEVSPGIVDIADYLYWKERFGATTPSGVGSLAAEASSVPEPGAICLLLAAAIVTLGTRRVGG